MKRWPSNRVQNLINLAATATLVTLCGCTPDLVYEKKFSTDHFDYYVEEGLEYNGCDDTGVWLERYYQGNAEFLGVSLPEGQKIQYHVVRNPQDPRLDCKVGIPCVEGTNVYSWKYLGRHEIVLATASLLGDPSQLFQQGLAEVLGCGEARDYKGPIEKLWYEGLVVSSSYENDAESRLEDIEQQAGSFVRYLLDTYGTTKFFSFYAHAPRNGKQAEIRAVFEQEFGVPLSDEFRKWVLLPALVPGDICIRAMECGSSIPEFTNGDVEMGCDPYGFGKLSESKSGIFRFHIDNDRPMQVITAPHITDPQAWSSVNFLSCSGGSALPFASATADFHIEGKPVAITVDPVRTKRRFVFDAPAGDYFVRFGAYNSIASIRAEMVDAMSPMRATCAPAVEPLLMVESETIVLSSRWMNRECNGFWCPGYNWDVKIGPKGGAIEVLPWTTEGRVMFSPPKVYLCSDPCPTNTNQCEMLVFDAEASSKVVQSKQVFAPGTVVFIGAPLASYQEHFALQMRIVSP